MDCVMHASLCVCVYVCVSTCCTIVVNSRQSCTMLFFSNEYSVTLANGDLKQTKKRENVNNLRNYSENLKVQYIALGKLNQKRKIFIVKITL